jgi:mevalonate kinase
MGISEFDTYDVPGRICLMGDKIDLIGLPVIAAAVDIRLTIKFRKRLDSKIKMYSETFQSGLEYNLGEKGDWNHYLKYWAAIAYLERAKIGGFEAYVTSKIPVGAGLSSSAAVSVALGKALNKMFNLNYDANQIAELAFAGENKTLGIQCGRMDQYSIAHGGVSFIETGDIPKVQILPVENLPVVVGDSQEERQAKKILNSIKERLNNKDPIVHNAFKTTHQCVLKAKRAIHNCEYQKLGELMSLQQEQENIIGAATPKLNKLCEVAKNAGAFGAKQMGAGGGGCMVAVCPGKQKEVADAITKAGGKSWIFNIFHYPEETIVNACKK